MAIVQISKIQVRTGDESDLPQLDIGEIGFTTDTKKVFIGNDPLLDPPVGIQPTLTQILTDSPNCHINASQITGVFNIRVSDLKISGGYNGYVLTTDGYGNLSWSAGGSGGGSGTVAGSNTQIQFNNEGAFGATGNLVFDIDTNTLTLVGNLVSTNIQGTIKTASQPNITSVGTLIDLDVDGNITSGNANLGNLTISNYFSGNGSLLTSVAATTAGTVTTNAQPNITSVGTLSGLIVSGVTRLGVLGNVRITGGSSGQIITTDGLGNLSWTTLSGSGSTYGNLDVKIFMDANYIPNFTGVIPKAQNAEVANIANRVSGINVTGTVNSANTAGTVTTAAQPNITSVGTLSSLTVSGNIVAGNVNVTNSVATYFIGNGSQLTSIAGANVVGTVGNAVRLTGSIDSSVTGVTQAASDNSTKIATTAFVKLNTTGLLESLYPVGAIYTSTNPGNPGTVFGFGTWVAFGAGKVLLGAGAGYVGGITGGSKDAVLVSHTHTATVTDPGHTHRIYQSHEQGGGHDNATYPQTDATGPFSFNTEPIESSTTGITVSNSTEGVSGTDMNMPPYIVVYMWNRTA